MDQQQAADVLRNLDQRTKRMEQILPDLPTRAEMHEAIQAAVAPLATKEELAQAIAPLATKEELRQAIAPLATREELRQGLSGLRDELRGHMDVWAERIHDQVKLAFEAIQGVDEKHTRNFGELRHQIVQLTRTEAQHHAATMKNFEELREMWRSYVKAHAKEHAESRKSFEKLTGRVEKLEGKTTGRRKVS